MNIKISNRVKNFRRNLFATALISFVIMIPLMKVSAIIKNEKNPPPTENVANGKIENPIKVNNINDFIKTILTGVIKISIPIIALAIIYSGFLFVSARGNSEKLGEAKRALLYTAIGAAILLGSWAIAQIISNTVLAL